jgi:hypothetical protein
LYFSRTEEEEEDEDVAEEDVVQEEDEGVIEEDVPLLEQEGTSVGTAITPIMSSPKRNCSRVKVCVRERGRPLRAYQQFH